MRLWFSLQKFWNYNAFCAYMIGFMMYMDKSETYKPESVESAFFSERNYKYESDVEIIVSKLEFNMIFLVIIERKIRFSEDMINSHGMMEKKSALDFFIDVLRYMISTQDGKRDKQYGALAKFVKDNNNIKVYAVVKREIDELMKISNEYFDIRYNDYLNAVKQQRGIE